MDRERLPLLIVAAVALAYGAWHLGWYLDTPLGQVPVLDERENLQLATAIAHGNLPAEPFYRAQGYALVLSLFLRMGTPAAALFPAALVLGLLLHALNALLVARIARQLFTPLAGLAAGLLAALNPVLLHYATQALDSTPSLSLFLLGLDALAFALKHSPATAGPWLRASLWWAAATLCRPNYLLPWALLPLLAFAVQPGRRVRLAAAAAGGAILFVAAGLWQSSVGGGFGFLPWQGPYNIWAANDPAGHGRYYVQKFPSPPGTALNPALTDSWQLYSQATGRPPTDVTAMNSHWRHATLARPAAAPVATAGLMLRKAYALFNDWDQYNNKTYAFHQARSPALRWNPLSWGLLLVCGVAGWFRLVHNSPRTGAALAAVALACAASALLVFVSGRFRLPLTGLLLVTAGGAVAQPRFWRDWSFRSRAKLSGAMLLATAVAWSRFDGVRDERTFVQDRALLARAAETTGDDLTAWREATAVLAQQPDHGPALALAVTAHFNLLLRDAAPDAAEDQWLACSQRLLAGGQGASPETFAIAALALWRAGKAETALAVWHQLGDLPSAQAARLFAGDPPRPPVTAGTGPEWQTPLAQLAGECGLVSNWPANAPSRFAHPRELAAKLFRQSAPTP